ncbi:DegT/DnrJ/EryC1/StrS family aminotransferase [Candidatus Omnitrophota bacterium]
MKIPLLDLKTQYNSIKSDIDTVMRDVLRRGQFILGENVKNLELEIAAYCGAKFAIGVASGSDALELSLFALGIGKGDEVITTPFTFIATSESICKVGAVPIFVDIDSDTYNISPGEIRKFIDRACFFDKKRKALINKKTKNIVKAVIAVHLYGQPCEMDELLQVARKYNLKIIEDCAQAIGAEYKGRKVGTFGDAGCFSFFPSKNLGAYGDGGMIVTSNKKIAENLKILRAHGSKAKYFYIMEGRNSRLDEVQAAILRVKLKYLDKWNDGRTKNVEDYNRVFLKNKLLTKLVIPKKLEEVRHVYHLYVVRTKKRSPLINFLRSKGISTAIHYPLPLHLQVVHRALKYKKKDFPNAERAAREVVALPIFPELTFKQIEYVVNCVKDFFESR